MPDLRTFRHSVWSWVLRFCLIAEIRCSHKILAGIIACAKPSPCVGWTWIRTRERESGSPDRKQCSYEHGKWYTHLLLPTIKCCWNRYSHIAVGFDGVNWSRHRNTASLKHVRQWVVVAHLWSSGLRWAVPIVRLMKGGNFRLWQGRGVATRSYILYVHPANQVDFWQF